MRSVVLYDTALCNLNCRYCFISKNPSINAVDKELEQCFLDENYFSNLLKHYVSEDEIKEIHMLEIWGGEPLLKLKRIYSFIKKLVDLAPDFNEIFFSSNFTHQNVIPGIQDLYNFLKENFPEKNFNISIQISCDGPEDITDSGRGLGTTKKIIDNFNNLLNEDLFTDKKIKFYFSIKPTLDIISLKKLLDYDYNIYYYKFFEDNFIEKLKEKNLLGSLSILPSPNLAVPANYTKEDGLLLKEVVKI